MRALVFSLTALAACGTSQVPGGSRDLSHGGLPDSHISIDEDGGLVDLAAVVDFAGADLTGLDLSTPPTDLAKPPDLASTLDPNLALPNPNGQPCSNPGLFSGCPSVSVCRFYTATEGRCESCSPCGNLNAFCNASSECDILFMCYQHKCTNFCTLGTSECGAPANCLNIGHATRGVCKP